MNEKIKKNFFLIIMIILCIAVVSGGVFISYRSKGHDFVDIPNVRAKKDDWKYDRKLAKDYGGLSINSIFPIAGALGGSVMDNSSMSFESNIGFSVGGAKDVNNFRENIENNYFPISTDITYNGLFYDYSFDTGRKDDEVSEDLFSPAYSTAVSKDPISGKNEYYMTVGLNSNIKESDFARKKLNLTIVLDISGSMGSRFNSYYYDFNENEKNDEDSTKSKMTIANESVNILIDKLNDDDRLGIVLFDDSSYLAKPLNLISETDVKALKKHILEIEDCGGTNFEAGYTEATKLYKNLKNENKDEYENRIIIITDAMPNYGTTSKEGLLAYVKENADDGIYTTFIGVGVDFNTELIEEITNVTGANYYSVHSSEEFKDRMGEQFEYMVTPLVFDLDLKLESDTFEILSVYGSDTVNKENGDIMKVNTLFPSKTNSNGEVKGGVVLLKLGLKPGEVPENSDINLKVSYKDRNGIEHTNEKMVEFNISNEENYDNTGIRKAIALTRYANTLKNWILYERTEQKYTKITINTGIFDCLENIEDVYIMLGENERASTPLRVSSEYKEIFKGLRSYLQNEIKEIKDESMNQEIKILDKLIEY